jgi:N-acetylmuramoyl-L-alanine amidase
VPGHALPDAIVGIGGVNIRETPSSLEARVYECYSVRVGTRSHLLPFAHRLTQRPLEEITMVVVHATEEPELADARRLAEASTDFVAAHFYIDRDGRTEEWVPITRVAYHTRGYNRPSVGVELVNLGRYPDHFASRSQVPREPFPDAQIEALEYLIAALQGACPRLSALRGHSELDEATVPATDDPTIMVRRRIDPGPMFPWDRVKARFATLRTS